MAGTSRKKIARVLSDEGARRLASYEAGERRKDKKRHHQWLCKPGSVCEPEREIAVEPSRFTEDPNWRIFRIMAEFIEGFEFLDKLHGEVSIFGSARATPEDPYFQQAKALGKVLAEEGYTVVTGGGPGIMEAANWGAFEGDGESIGLDIELPTEQRRNRYVTRSLGFHYFFTRKVMLSAAAQAYIFFPGGFGTLDEMTEMLTLIQTGKIPLNVPIILVGSEFWSPLVGWIDRVLNKERHYVAKEDMALLHVVETNEEAMRVIRKTIERPFGTALRKPSRHAGES